MKRNKLMRHIADIKISMVMFIFLFCIPAYLSADDEVKYIIPHSPETQRYSREEPTQHYLQGKEFYSQGLYTEARNEFDKALESVRPPTTGITEKAPQTPETVLQPVVPLPKSKQKLTKKEEEKKIEEEKEKGGQEARQREEIEEREYYIDVGDVLDISVWQLPDLSRPEVIVRPDGRISFPLIGDIKTEGLTLTALDNIITEKLTRYVRNPEVSIMIRRFGEQANKVVILGEVLSPGVYKFGGRPTITEVIAASGGYTKYAVLNSIMVIRGEVGSKPAAKRVNVAEVLRSAKLSENILLKPNDIVYVPRSFIGKVNVFLELIQPAISEYMQTLDARHFHNVMHRNQ